MACLRRLNSTTLFKCLVVPTMLLCAIFRNPTLQWIAFGALAIWLIVLLASIFGSLIERSRRRRAERDLAELAAPAPSSIEMPEREKPTDTDESAPVSTASSVFLIRQVNFRITEQLKATYPMVSWLWVKRPSVNDLCKGGVWKIRIAHADPFNFGEVTITDKGSISIVMLHAVSLKDADQQESEELSADDLLDRVDVKSWYENAGERVLAAMIDNLNAQGHKQVLIKENGEVCITLAGQEQMVEQIEDFPPRMLWEEFCHLLAEDEIKATVRPEGLAMAW